MWNRINPFSKQVPAAELRDSPDNQRRSSSLESFNEGEPKASPMKRRTPSILRTLAHHPSLSALKAKSDAKRLKRRPPQAIPTPVRKENLSGEFTRTSISSSEGKGLIRGCRSVPGDLRLSGGKDADDVFDKVRIRRMRFDIELETPNHDTTSELPGIAATSPSSLGPKGYPKSP